MSKKDVLATTKDLEGLLGELKKILITKEDIKGLSSTITVRIDGLEESISELIIETRNLRTVYQFWAKHYLTPEFIEKFLEEQELKRKKTSIN